MTKPFFIFGILFVLYGFWNLFLQVAIGDSFVQAIFWLGLGLVLLIIGVKRHRANRRKAGLENKAVNAMDTSLVVGRVIFFIILGFVAVIVSFMLILALGGGIKVGG